MNQQKDFRKDIQCEKQDYAFDQESKTNAFKKEIVEQIYRIIRNRKRCRNANLSFTIVIQVTHSFNISRVSIREISYQ